MTTDTPDAGLSPRFPALGILVIIGGMLLAIWIGFGHALFGISGDLSLLFVLMAAVVVTLQLFLGRAVILTARHGYRTRPRTMVIITLGWACGVLFGLTVPDVTSHGPQTILTGSHEPALGIAIGVTNPAGIICLGLTIAALVLAHGDARGGRPRYDEDAILDAQGL
ncbi:hypothetical protein [Leifsonia sp. Root112D2]|uniref:hypothetical protein n=1 Tax=Leifsonia sp. Root112D2 TaxID=1736426 RepID=UPI0006F9B34E|nr:hypothetical protein [Leifsonia sp. Root112D2]KQV06548.1 hypothetical protein ASC63_03725 [Leifsonia sp. Root112D2]